jgi:hypothetical protein
MDPHVVDSCNGMGEDKLCSAFGVFTVGERRMGPGIKMYECHLSGAGLGGNPGRRFRIKVRPCLIGLSAFVCTFSDQEISRPGKFDRVLTIARVGTIADDLAFQFNSITKRQGGMMQRFGHDSERDPILLLRQFDDGGFIGQILKRFREWAIEKHGQDTTRTLRASDGESSGKVELGQGVQADNMIQVKMTQEQINRTIIRIVDVLVRLGETVSGVENDMTVERLDQDTNRIARL